MARIDRLERKLFERAGLPRRLFEQDGILFGEFLAGVVHPVDRGELGTKIRDRLQRASIAGTLEIDCAFCDDTDDIVIFDLDGVTVDEHLNIRIIID